MSSIEKAMGKIQSRKPTYSGPEGQGALDNLQLLELDESKLAELGMVCNASKAENVAVKNEYRTIKQRLLKNAFGKNKDLQRNPNLVMISSANPGEGKTFNAINLALSIASEKDKTVLLIDADVLKPSVLKVLGLPKELPGLIDFLAGTYSNITDVIYPTSIPNLRILPAGRPQPQGDRMSA